MQTNRISQVFPRLGSALLGVLLASFAFNVTAARAAGIHIPSEEEKRIYGGYFEDNQIQARPLSDWEGDWKSVYPYLLDGTLDPVMQYKAEHGGDMTAEQYKAYYAEGYKTDVERIVIQGDLVTLYRQGQAVSAHYVSDGRETLVYKRGNRGVRYIFKKTNGDAAAPSVLEFSDHRIAPEKANHFFLYWGEDRAALLKQVTHWATYYPSSMSAEQLIEQMKQYYDEDRGTGNPVP